MGVNWTAEQQKVISLRNRNILVSAAAGSGKTAVLVERIITMLTKDESPVDVDRLLIVTFTEAAAAEMKERIRTAIEKKLEEEPDNEHLKRQETLIHNAMITTIHSFCLSVIRDHFHEINIDPGFRIADEGELKLLKHDVLEELLEEKYEAGTQRFLDFSDAYAGGRSDKNLEEMILKLYELGRSYPDQKAWLHDLVEAYRISDLEELERSEYTKLIRETVRSYLQDALAMLHQGIAICMEPDGPAAYETTLTLDEQIIVSLLEADSFSELSERIASFSWSTLARNKDKSVPEFKLQMIKNIRKEVKILVDDLKDRYFYQIPEEFIEDMKLCLPAMEELTELVELFSDRFEEKKRSKNMIDFSDMEQYALRILTGNTEEGFVPSEVAKEYQKQYLEVMIDEYQDSNLIQETILTSISTVWEGRNNIFMVGDVKQSIYRFRLSRPELFMEKFDSYDTDDSDRQRIDLHKNFRSRREVLESVNFIFRQLMTRELGGIIYDEQAALHVGADYPDAEHMQTEVLILKSDYQTREQEARMIAGKIRELMRTGSVLDKETGAQRSVRYSDIVILIRSLKGLSEIFAEVLSEEGIPVFVGTKEGYFATQEIGVLLDYLRVLDNRKQDVPLVAVLTSPFCGLTADELAVIRSDAKEMCFHQSVERYRSCGEDVDIREKLEALYGELDRLRELVPYTPMHELLRRLLYETGYGQFVAAMPGGARRQANVEMLVEKARAFEATSYKGLFHFIRYMEQLQKYNVDYGEANLEDEQSDTVRIMTIHKSKGLEFPVVFVSGMGKSFNLMDARSAVPIHPRLGVGLDAIDLEKRTKSQSLIKKIIQKEEALDSLAEELRVLYVALTRAKEKLIITGTCKYLDNKLAANELLKKREGITLSFYDISKASSYLDWIIPALATLTSDVPMTCKIVTDEEIVEEEIAEEIAGQWAAELLEDWDSEKTYNQKAREVLEAQFAYTYPFAKSQTQKMKFTVSELKKRVWEAETEDIAEQSEDIYQEPEVVPLIPKFLQKDAELTGASRGTAYHRVMELLDFTVQPEEERIREEIQQLEMQGKMTAEMTACVHAQDIYRFLISSIGNRMAQSAGLGKLYREQPFVIGIDAKDIYPQEEDREMLLVQGIIDAYFEESDGLVVVDYKTDKVKSKEELVEKYHAQLDYYAKALIQITGKPVKEKVIYSFTLREEIQL